MALAALLDLMIPALSYIGAGALVAVALAIAFPGAVLPRLAAFADGLLAARELRRRRRSFRKATRCPR